MKPWKLGERLLVDVQQIIPLPEAQEYQVKIRERERKARALNRDFTKFDETIDGRTHRGLSKRWTAYHLFQGACELGLTPEQIIEATGLPGKWRSVEGKHSAEAFKEIRRKALAKEGKTLNDRRWFLRDEDLIHADGRTYCVSNQWSAKWLVRARKLLDAHPGLKLTCEESVE